MNYGDRQPRVDFLLKALREKPDAPPYKAVDGKLYTAAQMADEIENETLIGRGFVAVAGIVLRALSSKTKEDK